MDTELRASTTVNADPAAVFSHFTDPVLLTHWLATTVRIDRTDADQVLHADADGRHITARALDQRPAGWVIYQWRITWPGEPQSLDTRLELAIHRDANLIRVDVVHWHLDARFLPRLQQDWHARLARLQQAASTR